MNIADQVYETVKTLPEQQATEVLDSVAFFKAKAELHADLSSKQVEIQDHYDTTDKSCMAVAMPLDATSAFRGKGKGGASARLLQDRQSDREQEA